MWVLGKHALTETVHYAGEKIWDGWERGVLGKHALTETVHYAGEAEALRSEVKKKEDQIWALTDTITRLSHQLVDKGLHGVCVCMCVCVCVCVNE